MRIYVHHDAQGNIRSFITLNAPKEISAGMTPKPGHSVAELSGAKLKLDPNDIEAVRKIAQSQKIANPAHTATLTKKR
jgi:hypothetical protein